MLRVRTTTGSVIKLTDKARFVEICDVGGKVAAIVFSNGYGVIKILMPGDEEFVRYIRTFKPDVTNVIEDAD